MRNKFGIFYGVGVGPGDPELMTVKAVKVLKRVHAIFTAASTKNDYSTALEIARSYIPKTAEIVALPFRMTLEQAARCQAREKNAKKVLSVLQKGRDAAFLTLGDPLTYSTFSYLAQALQNLESQVIIRTIPGITSYQGAAARLMVPLCEGGESLLILSGTQGEMTLKDAVTLADNIVVLKTYKNFSKILKTLEDLELADKTVGISCCGLEGEKIITDIRKYKDYHPSYFTLLIIKPNLRTARILALHSRS